MSTSLFNKYLTQGIYLVRNFSKFFLCKELMKRDLNGPISLSKIFHDAFVQFDHHFTRSQWYVIRLLVFRDSFLGNLFERKNPLNNKTYSCRLFFLTEHNIRLVHNLCNRQHIFFNFQNIYLIEIILSRVGG